MVTCARELKAPFAPSLSHILCIVPVLFRLLLSLVESSSIIERGNNIGAFFTIVIIIFIKDFLNNVVIFGNLALLLSN